MGRNDRNYRRLGPRHAEMRMTVAMRSAGNESSSDCADWYRRVERRSRSTSFNLLMKPLDDSLLRSFPRNASSNGNPARDTPLPMTMTDGSVV